MFQAFAPKSALLLVLLAGFSAPALAEGVNCLGEKMAADVSAPTATSALTAALGGTTINAASPDQLLTAYTSLVKADPTLASELAGIVALARPDVIESLSKTVAEVCPLAAESLKLKIDETAMNPSADQLAALANAEGTAPAAGDITEAPEANEGSPQ